MLQKEVYNQLDRLTKEELITIIIENQCFVSEEWVKKLSKREINIPFENFWQLYNYRAWSKKNAEVAWKRLTNQEREDAMKAVPIYVKNRKPEYICMATTWIHQKRWESILEEEKQKEIIKQKQREERLSKFSQGPLEWELQPIG